MEKWIIKNNTAGPFNMAKIKVYLRNAGDVVDLVQLTGRTVSQLEMEEEITDNELKGYFITLEKVSEPAEMRNDFKQNLESRFNDIEEQLFDLQKAFVTLNEAVSNMENNVVELQKRSEEIKNNKKSEVFLETSPSVAPKKRSGRSKQGKGEALSES